MYYIKVPYCRTGYLDWGVSKICQKFYVLTPKKCPSKTNFSTWWPGGGGRQRRFVRCVPRRLSCLAIACKPLVSSPVLSFYLLRRLNVVFRWDVGTEQKQGRKAAHSGTCFFNYILYNNSILEFLEDFYACHVTHCNGVAIFHWLVIWNVIRKESFTCTN